MPAIDEFPAAHSMDTTWFAVNAEGYVAEFCATHSPVPRLQVNADYTESVEVFRDSPSFPNYYVRDLYDRLHATLKEQVAWHRLKAYVRDLLQTDELAQLIHFELQAVRRQESPGNGSQQHPLEMFFYDGDFACSNYPRRGLPKNPVCVSLFPPFPAFLLQQVLFDAVRFVGTDHLCPLDWGACWTYRDPDAAYVVDELKPHVVLPKRGREDEFLQDYEKWQSWAQEMGYEIQAIDEFLVQYEENETRLQGASWGWCATVDREQVLRPRRGWEQEFLAGYNELECAARRRGLGIESVEEVARTCEEAEEMGASDGAMERKLISDCERRWLRRYLVSLQPHADGTVLSVHVRRGTGDDRVLGVRDGVLHIALAVDKRSARSTLLRTLGLKPVETISGKDASRKEILVRGQNPEDVYQRMKAPLAEARRDAMADDVYPAAHSMDTTWFAVDGEGNIGMFAAGQDGVVPWKAPRIEQLFAVAHSPEGEELLTAENDFTECHSCWDEWYLQRQLLWAVPEQIVLNASAEDLETHRSSAEYNRQQLENIEWQARNNPHREPPVIFSGDIDEQLMFLSSADPVQSYVAKGLAQVKRVSDFSGRVPASADGRFREWLSDSRWQGAVAVYFFSVELADWLKLAESGCLYCWDGENDSDMDRLGVYHYESHDRGDPYVVPSWRTIEQHLPACALHIDQLSGPIRPLIEVVRFDNISFSSAEPIMVTDHEPCYRYGEPVCFEYDPGANRLCCSVPGPLVDERAERMIRRAREEASRWGYHFEEPASPASREAQRRVLGLMRRHYEHEEKVADHEAVTRWLRHAQEWEDAIERPE
jgi:uncharacterized protein YggU (UPF0235/DUF167 family)